MRSAPVRHLLRLRSYPSRGTSVGEAGRALATPYLAVRTEWLSPPETPGEVVAVVARIRTRANPRSSGSSRDRSPYGGRRLDHQPNFGNVADPRTVATVATRANHAGCDKRPRCHGSKSS